MVLTTTLWTATAAAFAVEPMELPKASILVRESFALLNLINNFLLGFFILIIYVATFDKSVQFT